MSLETPLLNFWTFFFFFLKQRGKTKYYKIFVHLFSGLYLFIFIMYLDVCVKNKECFTIPKTNYIYMHLKITKLQLRPKWAQFSCLEWSSEQVRGEKNLDAWFNHWPLSKQDRVSVMLKWTTHHVALWVPTEKPRTNKNLRHISDHEVCYESVCFFSSYDWVLQFAVVKQTSQ